MKPWEETWVANTWGEIEIDGVAIGHFEDLTEAGTIHVDAGRARCAAQAPAMVRLLRTLEWCADDYEDGSVCPCCRERAPMTVHVPTKRLDAYTRIEAHDEVHYGVHAPDCEWVAIMKEAGVLP